MKAASLNNLSTPDVGPCDRIYFMRTTMVMLLLTAWTVEVQDLKGRYGRQARFNQGHKL